MAFKSELYPYAISIKNFMSWPISHFIIYSPGGLNVTNNLKHVNQLFDSDKRCVFLSQNHDQSKMHDLDF